MKQKYNLDNFVETAIPFFQGLGTPYALPTFARWEREFRDAGGRDMERYERIEASNMAGIAISMMGTFTMVAVGCDQMEKEGDISFLMGIWGGLLLGNVASSLYEQVRSYVFKK